MTSMSAARAAVTMIAVAASLSACSGGAADGKSDGAVTPSATATSEPSATSPGTAATPRTGGGKSTSSPSTAGDKMPSGRPTAPGDYDDTSGTTAKSPKTQTKVLRSFSGSTSASCVQVGSRPDVRSGSFGMGNFVTARKLFARGGGSYDAPESYFYVIPPTRTRNPLTVTLTPQPAAGKPIKEVSRRLEDAGQWKYYPVHVKIPRAGTWRFDVRSSGQRGCFMADFRG